jgi:hypothetical protein
VAFLFAPDWASMARPNVILAALGQAFFSIGVGMAVYVTYGSYMRREHSVPISADGCRGRHGLRAHRRPGDLPRRLRHGR